MKKPLEPSKKRNPIAKNLKVNKPKVIPNKKNAFSKASKPKGGQMSYPTYGV